MPTSDWSKRRSAVFFTVSSRPASGVVPRRSEPVDAKQLGHAQVLLAFLHLGMIVILTRSF